MILLIDNYDSFTYNLAHAIGMLGGEVRVIRNDDMDADAALALAPEAVVLSPGPGTPAHAGICVDLVARAPEDLPILGVCLGHQSIAAAYGGTVERCHEIMHGKLSNVTHDGTGLFRGVPQGFSVTRYHSLAVRADSLPDCLTATARTQSGVIMGLSHRTRPVHGVQFHPESIATEHGQALIGNFLDLSATEAA